MKKLSVWARHHKSMARVIIVASFFLLTALGLLAGWLLTETGFSLSTTSLVFFVVVYCVGIILYPSRSLKGKQLSAAAFYTRQKSCDLLLAGSTFLMLVFFSNRPGQLFSYSLPLQAAPASGPSLPADSTVKQYKTIAAFAASMKDQSGQQLKWKEKKKLLKEQVRAIRKSDMSRGAKIALILLAVLVAAGLLALIMGLSCELSCSGAEGAAVLVGVGGAILIGFLLVLVIRGILGKRKKKRKIDPDDPGVYRKAD